MTLVQRFGSALALESDAFRGPYLVYLQGDPDVVIANAVLRPLLARAGVGR